MRERLGEVAEYTQGVVGEIDDVVLLGMGGSSLAPEVLRRAFGRVRFHVLDTTHPKAIRRLARLARPRADAVRRLVQVGLDARDALALRLLLGAQQARRPIRRGHRPRLCAREAGQGAWVARLLRRTDDRRPLLGALDVRAAARRADVGRPRPAARRGRDGAERLPRRGRQRRASSSGSSSAAGGRSGRDKIVFPDANGFGLWLEQLLAESTGKEGKGLVPAPGERPDGPDRQPHDVEIADPYDLGSEFFRWEFATAVAGAILGINPFNQPNVQEAKDRTGQILAAARIRG